MAWMIDNLHRFQIDVIKNNMNFSKVKEKHGKDMQDFIILWVRGNKGELCKVIE